MNRQEYNKRKLNIQHRMNMLLQAEIKADNFLDELGCNHCYKDDACATCKHTKLCEAIRRAGIKRNALTTELGRLYKDRMGERRCNA